MSRPFQLALDFSIVPYGVNISGPGNFDIGLIQSEEWPSANNFATKSEYAKTIITKYDCINLNVIKGIAVIMLTYRYGINSIEQCVTLSNYHNIYILIFY